MLGAHRVHVRSVLVPAIEQRSAPRVRPVRSVGGHEPGSTVRAVLSRDPRPTSFENHPGLRGREPEARDLADVLRRLIRLSVSTAPSPAETVRLTAQLAAVADELESHLPEVPLPRFIPPDEDGPRSRFRSGAPCPTTSSSVPSTRSRSLWCSISNRPRRSVAPSSTSPTRERRAVCTAPSWPPPSTSS